MTVHSCGTEVYHFTHSDKNDLTFDSQVSSYSQGVEEEYVAQDDGTLELSPASTSTTIPSPPNDMPKGKKKKNTVIIRKSCYSKLQQPYCQLHKQQLHSTEVKKWRNRR